MKYKVEANTGDPRTQFVELLDRPLVGLSFVALALYAADLWGAFSQEPWPAVHEALEVAIDFIFVADLILKLWFLRRAYVRTPWFVIDLLSCLPALDLLNDALSGLEYLRFVRIFRVFRILRTMRVLRVVRSIPAVARYMTEEENTARGQKFSRAMSFGVLSYSILLLLIVVHLRRSMDAAAANRVELYLVTGSLLSMSLFFYIMVYQLHDVSLNQLRALMNVALPRQVAEHFMTTPEAYDRKDRGPATILFVDFVGFTKTCEELSHDITRLSHHLETAMDTVVQVLFEQDLIIDKFIGDAIMSFRGGPLVSGNPGEHAYRVVRGALNSARTLAGINDPYFGDLKIGGASADDCLIGAFGTSTRLSYTVLGNAVNLAARLEPASKQCGTRNLFCETTYQLCAERRDLAWRRWGRLRVPGKAHPFYVYEAFDAGELGDGAFIETFQTALAAFEQKDLRQANSLFLRANEQRFHNGPSNADPPSQFYAGWCQELMRQSLPSDWEPVWTTSK